jgi:hypothetical protein
MLDYYAGNSYDEEGQMTMMESTSNGRGARSGQMQVDPQHCCGRKHGPCS